jgi:ABC-2 type transport system ATP-binding protein
MIIVNNLQKKYINQIVVDIPELSLTTNTITSIVGNNGAGKTTFFKLLLDLIPPNNGYIEAFGNKICETENWKDEFGCFLDESFLIDFLSVEEYFDFILKINEITLEHYKLKLKQFNFFFNEEILQKKKYIRSFSTGNKYKIGIAGALLKNSKLVLLDEPFAHLDPSGQIQLKKIMKDINNSEGIGFLISSHNLEHVVEISDRVILLESGKIINDMRPSENTLQELKNYFSL